MGYCLTFDKHLPSVRANLTCGQAPQPDRSKINSNTEDQYNY